MTSPAWPACGGELILRRIHGLLRACAYILEGRSLSITDTEYMQLKKSLKEHEGVEKKMLMQIDGLMKVIKDERIVMMLSHIRYLREASKRSLKALKNQVLRSFPQKAKLPAPNKVQ